MAGALAAALVRPAVGLLAWVFLELGLAPSPGPWLAVGAGAVAVAGVAPFLRSRATFAGATALAGCLALQGLLAPRLARMGGLDLASDEVAAVGLPVFLIGFWGSCAVHRILGLRSSVLAGLPLAAAAAAALFVSGAVNRAVPAEIAAPATTQAPPAKGERAILLVLDTVGADHLSVYGYPRQTTPALASWLAAEPEAVVYPRAYASSPWTVPSHATLFTGLSSSRHGAHYREGDSRHSPFRRLAISADVTLAERVRAAGGRTSFVSANAYTQRVDGLERGFDAFVLPAYPRPLALAGERLRKRWLPGRWARVGKYAPHASAINREVLARAADCGDPCLVAANYMEAHAPYVPSAPFAGRFGGDAAGPHTPRIDQTAALRRAVVARYDEALLELDHWLGVLLAGLDARPDADRTWLVITSDHGEAFGDHALVGHGTGVYDDQVRIPLIVRPPRGTRLPDRDAPVGLADVAATLAAALTGEPIGEGRDLREPARGDGVGVEFFGGNLPPSVVDAGPPHGAPARAVVQGSEKLIERAGRLELYDLDVDPTEQRDLAGDRPERLRALTPRLPPLDAGSPPHDPGGQLDASEREALRALGYLDD